MSAIRPSSRINPDILTDTYILSLRDVVKGDHINNYGAGINDSIVVTRDLYRGIVELVSGENDGENFIVKHRVIDLNEEEVVTKLVYSCPDNSHVWVQRATSQIGTKTPIAEVTHASAFIMRCKRGDEIHWEDAFISQLKVGDHFSVGTRHGIVETIRLRQQELHYITVDSKHSTVQRQTYRDVYQFKKATYNTCCTNDGTLSYAKYLLEQPGNKFENDFEFSVHCKSGFIDTPIPLSEATLLRYAPPTRQYNTEVITKWTPTPLTGVLRGDHVTSEDCNIPQAIAEKRTGRTLHLIGCIQENGQSVITRFSREVPSLEAILDVAVYTSSVDSGSAVKKALSLVGSSRAKSFIDHEIDFVMLCKRGEEIEWRSTFINRLRRGEHVTWGYNDQHHGIVQHVNSAQGTIMCFMYRYRGIQCVKVENKTEFRRAIYNSCYDADTVLKLAERRVGESKYHPFGNDDFDLARWCKTGQYKSRRASKTLVLSADMLKRGDQVSWTRWATYDHHALINRVLGPNQIEVYEFTSRAGDDKTGRGKTYKRKTILAIFSGSDPVYKVTYIAAEDPEKLLEQAAKQEGNIGGYSPVDCNCENYAGNVEGMASQAKAFFIWLKTLFVKWCPKVAVSVFDDVIEEVIAYAFSAGATVGGDMVVEWGLHRLMDGLNAAVIALPIGIEVFMMIWDINHKWADHKTTRIVTGSIGTALTSLVMWQLAAPAVSVSASIGLAFLAIFIGIVGTTVTTLIMRFMRRSGDQQKCREAFRGLYEEQPSPVERFAQEVMQEMQENTEHISETVGAMVTEMSEAR